MGPTENATIVAFSVESYAGYCKYCLKSTQMRFVVAMPCGGGALAKNP